MPHTSNKISRDIKTPPHMKETEVPQHLRGFMLIKLGYHLLPETFNNNTHHFCFLPQFHSTVYHSYCMWILAFYYRNCCDQKVESSTFLLFKC